MVFFNYATMQMAAKIVYYGPGLCGKTTNLHHIYARTSPQSRGEMVSLETETDRTLFFDLLPIDVGVIGGFKTRLQLYTVPGQVFYNTTRKLVLKGVDGIVFVADSQTAALDANAESYRNLRENLAEISLDIDEIPLVVQVNKRDLPNIATVEAVLQSLDPSRSLEHVEAIASAGTGVFETLKLISKLTLRTLRRRMTGEDPLRRTTTAPIPAQFRVRDDESGRSTPSPGAGPIAGSTAVPVPATPPASPAGPVASTGIPSTTPPQSGAVIEPEPFDTTPVAAAVLDREEPIAPSSHEATGEEPPRRQDEPPAAEPFAPIEGAASAAGGDATADAAASGLAAETPDPPVKTVKVRSSVDVMAELEALRKRATQSTKLPKRDILADLTSLQPKRNLHRTLQTRIPADVLPRTRAVRVTLSFEDSESGVIESQEEHLELGDTSDVQSLSVNLKIDLK
jgi:mutual gliding-motility protein MglA